MSQSVRILPTTGIRPASSGENPTAGPSEGWTREQVIEFENDWTHYLIESPSPNMSHRYERLLRAAGADPRYAHASGSHVGLAS